MSSIKTYPYNPAAQEKNNNLQYSQQHHEYEEDIPVNATVVHNNNNESPSAASSYSPQVAHEYHTTSTVVPPNHASSNGAIVESPNYVPIDSRKPVMLSYCPKCTKSHVTTVPRTKATGATWLGVVAGVVIFWPLCWVPLVAKPMKQTNHYCPCCGAKVGRVRAFH